MKLTLKIIALLIIASIINASIISVTNAETSHISKEYSAGQRANLAWYGVNVTDSPYTNLFTYNVTMYVETEQNGEWVLGNSYEIRWKISLIYLNNEFKDPTDFSFTVYSPEVEKYADTKQVINQTYVQMGQDGLLIANCTPNQLLTQANISSRFYGHYVFDGDTYPCPWHQYPDISINITSPAAIPTPTPTPPQDRTPPHSEPIDYLPYFIALIIIVIGTTFLLLSYRKHRALQQDCQNAYN